MFKKYQIHLLFFLWTAIAMAIHFLLSKIPESNGHVFYYTKTSLYLYFTIVSYALVWFINWLSKLAPTAVGVTFLVLNLIYIVVTYLFLNTVLSSGADQFFSDKIDILFIFALFQSVVVYLCCKILNKIKF